MDRLPKALPPLASLLPFEAAARHESFTRAAAELKLTQAAVSRQIRALEDDLGTRLFERRNRAVFLTEAGRALGRAVTGGLESIAREASRLRGERRSGEVVLFAQLCEALYWVMPRLSRFHQRHPEIELRVAASTRPLVESTEPFDVALQTSGRASGAHPLVFIASEEVFPVCSPAYLAGRRTPLALADLPNHHLLHHKADPQDWLEWDDWLERLGLKLRFSCKGTVFDSYPVMVQAAAEGHGLALGWHRTMERLLQSGALVRPFAESVVLPDGLSVYQRRAGRPQAEARALLRWLRSELTP
jgi:LysR family transcriptional regulator, glycine cleavage system transcriptional activator